MYWCFVQTRTVGYCVTVYKPGPTGFFVGYDGFFVFGSTNHVFVVRRVVFRFGVTGSCMWWSKLFFGCVATGCFGVQILYNLQMSRLTTFCSSHYSKPTQNGNTTWLHKRWLERKGTICVFFRVPPKFQNRHSRGKISIRPLPGDSTSLKTGCNQHSTD